MLHHLPHPGSRSSCGYLTDVAFDGAEVLVTLSVNEEHQQRITEQSRAAIGSLSLLGEPIIEITPSAEGRPLQDGEFIQSARTAGQIADVAAGATDALGQATEMLRDIRAGKGSVGKLFTDDQLYRDIQGFIASAETVADHVAQGRGTLGMLAKDPKAYQQLEAALTNLRDMTRRINAGEGSLGRLLNDEALAKSLTATASNMDEITARINRGEGTAGKETQETGAKKDGESKEKKPAASTNSDGGTTPTPKPSAETKPAKPSGKKD